MTTELDAAGSGVLDSCAETVRIRVLPESALQPPGEGEQLSKELPVKELPAAAFDPYRSDHGARSAGPESRRTLDDMRRLSEAIVRSRNRK